MNPTIGGARVGGFLVAVAIDDRRRGHMATVVPDELRMKDAERFIGRSLR